MVTNLRAIRYFLSLKEVKEMSKIYAELLEKSLKHKNSVVLGQLSLRSNSCSKRFIKIEGFTLFKN